VAKGENRIFIGTFVDCRDNRKKLTAILSLRIIAVAFTGRVLEGLDESPAIVLINMEYGNPISIGPSSNAAPG
jgi:hypothetical protein